MCINGICNPNNGCEIKEDIPIITLNLLRKDVLKDIIEKTKDKTLSLCQWAFLKSCEKAYNYNTNSDLYWGFTAKNGNINAINLELLALLSIEFIEFIKGVLRNLIILWKAWSFEIFFHWKMMDTVNFIKSQN